MNGALIEIALACFFVGALIDAVFGVVNRVIRSLPYLFGLAGSACLSHWGFTPRRPVPLSLISPSYPGLAITRCESIRCQDYFLRCCLDCRWRFQRASSRGSPPTIESSIEGLPRDIWFFLARWR